MKLLPQEGLSQNALNIWMNYIDPEKTLDIGAIAKALGISHQETQEAFEELEHEGLIEIEIVNAKVSQGGKT